MSKRKRRIVICLDCSCIFKQGGNCYLRCGKCRYRHESPKYVEQYVEHVIRDVRWWLNYNRTHPPSF